MDWCHPDASAHDCAGPDMPHPNHGSQYHDAAHQVKSRLLFVSFSDSETAFLARTAKTLVASGKWECSFLLLHDLARGKPILAEFDALGISHFSSPETQFYADYEERQLRPTLNSYFARLLHWWRKQKIRRRYLRFAVPLIQMALFTLWFFARYLPWILRYGVRIVVRKIYTLAKQFLYSNHPALHNWLRDKAFAFLSVWFETPWISKYYLESSKLREKNRIKVQIDAAGRFYMEQMPNALILAKDSSYYPTIAFVQAAKNMGMTSVVIPYDRADAVTLAKDRLGHPHHVIRSHAARKIANQFPAWVYTYEGQSLLLTAPATVYAIEQLNLSPPNPWGYNSSRCDKIFLETEEDRQLFLMDGAPSSQLAVIGAPYMDSIDEMLGRRDQLRDQLCSEFAFDPDKPFVVASVPPNKVSQRRSEIEFQDYRTLIDKWSSALAKNLDCNLIYSLHPLTDPADVGVIEKTGGKILRRPLEELLAVADLYVVDCSSTTRWARYAGLDVIDYDVYRYNLWFNSDIKGVRHITSYEQFLVELTEARERLKRVRDPIPNSVRQPPARNFGERLSLELANVLASNGREVRNVF
jgi:hypothetical protein